MARKEILICDACKKQMDAKDEEAIAFLTRSISEYFIVILGNKTVFEGRELTFCSTKCLGFYFKDFKNHKLAQNEIPSTN